jgi:hypothetical protein
MKKPLLLTLALVPLLAFGQSESVAPKPKIDVAQLPAQAKMIDEVVVPVPSEIFGVLDKLGRPHWEDVLRPTKGLVKPIGEPPQIALLLGTVIAEGFIAVEAENTEEVKKIGKSVLNLAAAINVRQAVLKRSNSIIEAADKKNWPSVRRELDGALADVKKAMIELNSEELSQLVSLGGWLRGTEALTSVVKRNFSRDGAELLHQPVLLQYFDRRIQAMSSRRRDHPLVQKVHQGVLDIRPLVGLTDSDISEKTVNEINGITERLIKGIISKPTN